MVTNKLDTHLANTLIPSPTMAIADTSTTSHFLREATNNAPSSLPHLYISNYLMAISSVLLAPLPSIGQAYHAVPHRLTSFPNLTHTPSFQLASSATTITLQFLTNTMSLSHATTTASFIEPTYPMDFGAYHSTPHNHKPLPSYQDLVQWLHAAAFSPSISTFLDAVEHNFFTTWPNLTPQIIH